MNKKSAFSLISGIAFSILAVIEAVDLIGDTDYIIEYFDYRSACSLLSYLLIIAAYVIAAIYTFSGKPGGYTIAGALGAGSMFFSLLRITGNAGLNVYILYAAWAIYMTAFIFLLLYGSSRNKNRQHALVSFILAAAFIFFLILRGFIEVVTYGAGSFGNVLIWLFGNFEGVLYRLAVLAAFLFIYLESKNSVESAGTPVNTPVYKPAYTPAYVPQSSPAASAVQSQTFVFCPECGTRLAAGNGFCSKCGSKLP